MPIVIKNNVDVEREFSLRGSYTVVTILKKEKIFEAKYIWSFFEIKWYFSVRIEPNKWIYFFWKLFKRISWLNKKNGIKERKIVRKK